MIEVERVDFVRVPVTDMECANRFYGELLGLPRNPNSLAEDRHDYALLLHRRYAPYGSSDEAG